MWLISPFDSDELLDKFMRHSVKNITSNSLISCKCRQPLVVLSCVKYKNGRNVCSRNIHKEGTRA